MSSPTQPISGVPPTQADLMKEREEKLKALAEVERLKKENQELRDLFQASNPGTAVPEGASIPSTFDFSGRVGGTFSIDGTGFGDVVGLVILNNRPVHTTRWNDRSIKGMVPSDFKPGPITVVVNGVKLQKTVS